MDLVWMLLLPVLGLAADIQFENAELGFFFQQSLGSSPQQLPKFPSVHSYLNSTTPAGPDSKVVLRERLTVPHPQLPGRIQVTYGPFEAKQTLPGQFVIPIINFPQDNYSLPFDNTDHASMDITAHIVSTDLRRENPILRVLFHSGKHFHSPISDGHGGDKRSGEEAWDDDPAEPLQTCIALRVHNPNGGVPLVSTCAPQGLDGVCLASATIPYDWWITTSPAATFPATTGIHVGTVKPSKAIRSVVELSYAVYEIKSGQCHQRDELAFNKWQRFRAHKAATPHVAHFPPANAILIQSPTQIASLRLSPNIYASRDLIASEEAGSVYPTLRFLSTSSPLYPQSHFYVTVLIDSGTQPSSEEPYAVVVRVKVKDGLRIVSTQTVNPAWNLNFDINGKHVSASATCVRNFSASTTSNRNQQELFTWLLAVNVDGTDGPELKDGARALWSWTIRSHIPYRTAQAPHAKENLDELKGKFTSRFEILKDQVQSVFPIVKRKELFNTAILTGRQVSQPLRVFMMTQGGKVADVTLQASCSSTDESILKVSSSCTSVYLDGSEVRGSTNGTFIARYGNVESTGSITVWVPELPLEIQIEDNKLNQILGWKVQADRNQCRLRYQQTSVSVFARFYAEDHDSGRVSYFLSRKTYLLVTELVRKVMRVHDPRIASFKNDYLEGLKAGKTEVQVLSPMSGQVIGAREVRVSTEKVDITHLSVQVISGVLLSLIPDQDLESCYVAQVDITEKLISKYQEAVLDLMLHFSDGTWLALRHTDRSQYSVNAECHNGSILALTSSPRSAFLRVLALGDGRATVSVAVTGSESCAGDAEHPHPLAEASVAVNVVLRGGNLVTVQNDARTRSPEAAWPDVTQSYTLPHTPSPDFIESAAARNRRLNTSRQGQGQLTFSKPGSTEFVENQMSLKDDSNAILIVGSGTVIPHSQSRLHHNWSHLTPLEVGMYVLLGVFCSAILVFVGTCVVYASRARKQAEMEDGGAATAPATPTATTPLRMENLWSKFQPRKPGTGGGGRGGGDGGADQETSDKDWVWLGRSSLEAPSKKANNISSGGGDSNGNHVAGVDKERNRLSGYSYSGSEVSVRITSHPHDGGGRMTYHAELCFSQDSAGSAASLADNRPSPSIDSQTYTKKAPRSSPSSGDPSADPESSQPLLPPNVVRRGGRVPRLSEQDTRRYARSWLMAGEAVPRHFNSNDLSDQVVDGNSNFSDEPDTADAATAPGIVGTFLRNSPDIKQANIIENPRFSDTENNIITASNRDSNATTADQAVAVDYERIISYLGVLKETSA